MSYSRDYHESITVRGSTTTTVSYPKSETGGSMPVTVHYTEHVPIDIRIDVDTNPFDRSISSANNHVNLLTGSVVAAEAGQLAAKIKSAEDISDTMINGFFGLIRSEINQQLAVIQPKVEALIIELMQHQETCAQKKVQLEGDFAKISERYERIFSNLDKELRNRILLLNQSAVGVHGTLTTNVHRSLSDISSGIATIYNKESGVLQSMLFASSLKSKALSLIDNTKKYLFFEINLSNQLHQILIPVKIEKEVLRKIPVLYLESKAPSSGSDITIFSPGKIPALAENKKVLKNAFSNSSNKWEALSSKAREQINNYLAIELSGHEENKNIIKPRVAQRILDLWRNDTKIHVNN